MTTRRSPGRPSRWDRWWGRTPRRCRFWNRYVAGGLLRPWWWIKSELSFRRHYRLSPRTVWRYRGWARNHEIEVTVNGIALPYALGADPAVGVAYSIAFDADGTPGRLVGDGFAVDRWIGDVTVRRVGPRARPPRQEDAGRWRRVG